MIKASARLIAGALASSVALGLVSVATSPAAAATAHTVELSSQADDYYYFVDYEPLPGTVSRSINNFSISLPNAYLDLDADGRQYHLITDGVTEYGSVETAGSVVTGNLPPLAPNTAYTLVIVSYKGWFESRADASFSFVTDSVDGARSTLSIDHTTLDSEFVVDGDLWNLDGPAITVEPGDTVIFTAAAGFFTGGPDGDWNLAESSSYGGAYRAESSVFANAEIAADGGSLTVTVPRPGWGFRPGEQVSLYGEVVQEHLDQNDVFVGFDFVTFSIPVVYAAAAGEPRIERIEGDSRFSVAQNIAVASYPDGADVVYVTNGLNYPDALSAAPAAAFEGGPLLLTFPNALPDGFVEAV